MLCNSKNAAKDPLSVTPIFNIHLQSIRRVLTPHNKLLTCCTLYHIIASIAS